MINIKPYVFPMYGTVGDSVEVINPYYEFLRFSVDSYIEKFSSNLVGIRTFVGMEVSDRIEFLKSILPDYEYSFDENYLKITYNGDLVCSVGNAMDDIYFNRHAISDGMTVKKVVKLQFVENDCMGFLMNTDKEYKSNNYYNFVMIDDDCVQMNILLSLIYGLCNFGDFIKKHKMYLIKTNTIKRYISDKFSDVDGVTITYVHDYWGLVVVVNVGMSDVSSIKLDYYTNYIEDIDNFVKKFING